MMRRTALGHRDRSLLREASGVLGLDEVGRGALAGPVVIAGALFSRIPRQPLVQDSKTLDGARRERAAAWVRQNAEGWAVVEIGVELIDRLNILQATRVAMTGLIRSLGRAGVAVVTDAVLPSDGGLEVNAVSGADGSYFCVAAASILAKVHRDRLMRGLDRWNPAWEWQTNVGYGTPRHRAVLDSTGRGFLHRRTFVWRRVLE